MMVGATRPHNFIHIRLFISATQFNSAILDSYVRAALGACACSRRTRRQLRRLHVVWTYDLNRRIGLNRRMGLLAV